MNTKLQMSLLDRLAEGDDSRPTLARIRQAVRRDLECLLNARRSWLPLEQGGRELQTSVLGYGLPDFTVMDLGTDDGRQWLCDEVRDTISRFEPRLTRIQVTMRDADTPLDRQLRLRIDAVLLVDPVPEPVSFDSEVEPVTLAVTLQECA